MEDEIDVCSARCEIGLRVTEWRRVIRWMLDSSSEVVLSEAVRGMLESMYGNLRVAEAECIKRGNGPSCK